MKPGTIPLNPFGEQDQVKMNPPRGSADLVKPAGPTDPQVCVVSVQTAAGKPLAVLANYSLHYVGDVGPGHVSADYYGVFCDKLQQMLGADRQDPPFVAMLSNGTSGNINNIDFLHAAKPGPKYSKINQVADDIAKVAPGGDQAHGIPRMGALARDVPGTHGGFAAPHSRRNWIARAKSLESVCCREKAISWSGFMRSGCKR